MSQAQTKGDEVEGDKDEQDRRTWIKAELQLDVPRRDRSGAFLSKTRAPKPQWTDGTVPQGEAPKGPTIGGDRGESAFNIRLGQEMDTIELVRKIPPTSEKAKQAKEAMEKRLSDMTQAAEDKNFTLAGVALDDALESAQTVSDERVAAKKLFDDAFYPLQEKLTASTDKTKGLTGIDGAVATAEGKAGQSATAAEQAADDNDYAKANELLAAFTIDMNNLATAYTDAGNALDTTLGKRIARLERRRKGLKGTALTADAAKAKIVQGEVTQARSDATVVTPPEARLAALVAVRDKLAEADTEAQTALKTKSNKSAASGLTEIRAGAASAINDMAEGDAKQALLARLAEWDKQKVACDKETDLDKQKTALGTLDKSARKMMDDALKGVGDDDAKAKKQEVFKKALETRFGLVITVPTGMTNTHFDQFYDMMNKLPVQQASHDKLQKLLYDATSKGAAYSNNEAKVIMGSYADADWNYKNPVTGVTEPLNGFNISSLHEIGHAVDSKYKIMQNNRGNAGCGEWVIETAGSVAQAFLKDLKDSAGSQLTADDPTLLGLLNDALTKAATPNAPGTAATVKLTGDHKKPGPMQQPEWLLVKAQLNRAVNIRTDKSAWGPGKGAVLNNRSYHQAYDWQWVSYNPAARTGTEVRAYQFRAPAEWFAELYAYTWYNEKKAPTGVDKTVAKYMYSAKA